MTRAHNRIAASAAASAHRPVRAVTRIRLPQKRCWWLAFCLLLLHVARCEPHLTYVTREAGPSAASPASKTAQSTSHRSLQGQDAFSESPRPPPVAPTPPRLPPAAPVPPLSPLPTRALIVDACETKGAYREERCRSKNVDTQATVACCFDHQGALCSGNSNRAPRACRLASQPWCEPLSTTCPCSSHR